MDTVIALAVVVPLASAPLVAGVGHLAPKPLPELFTIAVAAVTAALCAVVMVRAGDHQVVHWFGDWTPRQGFAVGVDFEAGQLNAALALFVAVLVVAVSVFAWRYFEAPGAVFHALLLVFCAAMVGFCLSGDVFNMFVFFEVMSVAAFGLTAYKSDERGPIQGALNFGVTNSIGGFFLLFGIALLYGRTHALNLAQLGRSLDGHPADALVVAAFTLIAVGLLVKAAAVPFHFWLADAHAVAPTPVCVLFSGVMVQLGFYGLVRVYWSVFAGAMPPSAALRAVLVSIGVVTAVVGAVMCLGQHHVKRLLALSTVSHGGLVLIGIGLLSTSGLAGAAVYAVAHGLTKATLFVCAGIVLHRKGKIDDHHLHGRCRDLPLVATLWFIGGLALAGLPPFGTYLGKGLIDEAAHHQGASWLALVGVVASALTGAAVLRAGAHLFFGWGKVDTDATSERHGSEQGPETLGAHDRTPAVMYVPAVALLVSVLGFGLLPGLSRHADRASERFVDRGAIAAEVLDGRPTPVSEPSSASGPTSSMAVSGALSAALAVAVAALALWREHVPEAVRRRMAAVALPPIRALRSLHSGHVGDYVAWLTVGSAALGGAIAFAVAHP